MESQQSVFTIQEDPFEIISADNDKFKDKLKEFSIKGDQKTRIRK